MGEAKGADDDEDTGKFKQATGNYQDYFAAKMAALKAKGHFKEVPDWKEEAAFGGGQTLGLGAGNGRAVDREIQRESLLCPDYLKAAKERGVKAHEGEEQVGEDDGEKSGARKRKKQKVNPSTDDAKEEVEHMEEEEGEVKKSKKRKKDKKERSPADNDDDQALSPDNTENLEPLKKKKKKNRNTDANDENQDYVNKPSEDQVVCVE